MKRRLTFLFAAALLAGGLAGPAGADLRALSPGNVDPAAVGSTNPFPLWIEDKNGFRLAPCTDLAVCLEGIALPPFPGTPGVVPPDFEMIYFAAEALADVGTGADGLNPARVRLIMAVEAFPDELDPNVPVLSNGILVRIDNALPGDYRVTLPYDVDHDDNPATAKVAEFTLTPGAGARVLATFPAEAAVAATLPTSITDALRGPIDTFLFASATEGGAPLAPVTVGTSRFLFDGGVLEAETFVTGSPTGRNFARIIGPAGFGTVRFDKFALFGQLPDIHERRVELNTRKGRVEVSGSSTLPAGSVLTISTEEAAPVQIGTTTVRADGTFRFTTKMPRTLPGPATAPRDVQVRALRIDPPAAVPPAAPATPTAGAVQLR